MLQRTLDLMVLQTLDRMGPLHGYGIARRIEKVSDDTLKLNEGTVYASLTQEIGIRMALGATGPQVRALVLRQATFVLGIGLVVGTSGALAFGHWLRTFPFEISPSDPRILLAAGMLLTITGLVAAWLPARRASRVTPRNAMQEG